MGYCQVEAVRAGRSLLCAETDFLSLEHGCDGFCILNIPNLWWIYVESLGYYPASIHLLTNTWSRSFEILDSFLSASSPLFVKASQDTHFNFSDPNSPFNNACSQFSLNRRQLILIFGAWFPVIIFLVSRLSCSSLRTALFPVLYRIDLSGLVQYGDEVEHWHGLTRHLSVVLARSAALQKVLMYTGSTCWGTFTAAVKSYFWFAMIAREKSALLSSAVLFVVLLKL